MIVFLHTPELISDPEHPHSMKTLLFTSILPEKLQVYHRPKFSKADTQVTCRTFEQVELQKM